MILSFIVAAILPIMGIVIFIGKGDNLIAGGDIVVRCSHSFQYLSEVCENHFLCSWPFFSYRGC